MKGSVVGTLILKDWQLQSSLILFAIIGGTLGLAVVQLGGEPASVVGTVWFFIALMLLACMLPMANILNERKKQNLAFLMSLPVSPLQYAISKFTSTFVMFVVPWLAFLGGALWLILVRGVFPHGVIPITLVLLNLTFIGYCIIFSATLVGESEGWAIAANVGCNSSYGLVWYFITRVPALTADVKSPVVVWNRSVLNVLALEAGLIVLILGLSFYLQSRKRDFI
jgi:ABC-2 type transport system permease protein